MAVDKGQVKKKVSLFYPANANIENQEEIIDYAVDKVINDVSNYCHILATELPDELFFTTVSMVNQLISSNELLTPVADRTDNVASITEGDVAVTYKSKGDMISAMNKANVVTNDFVKQLNKFRRVPR